MLNTVAAAQREHTRMYEFTNLYALTPSTNWLVLIVHMLKLKSGIKANKNVCLCMYEFVV